MGLKNSGKLVERAAPYFRYIAATTASDLTEAVGNARCATSGLIPLLAAGGNLVIEDASGSVQTIVIPAGCFAELPIAAVRIDVTNAVPVLAFWHPRGGAA